MEKTNKGIMEKLFEVKKAWIKLQRDAEWFNYKYATLSQIQEKLSEVLQEQKLVVLHYIKDNCVVTEICDIEYCTKIESAIPMSEGTKPQDKGSEISYYRRYNLLSLLDLEVEDDDGAKAQKSTSKKQEEDDNKEWFAKENFDVMAENKDKFTKENIVKKAREKYKVSNAFAQRLQDLYD